MTSMRPINEQLRDPQVIEYASHFPEFDSYHTKDGYQIDGIGHIATREGVTYHLDHLSKGSELHNIQRTLGCLPMQNLLYECGPEITAWTIGNGDDTTVSRLTQPSMDEEGLSAKLWRHARAVRYRNDNVRQSDDVFAQYQFMEHTLGSTLANLPLDKILEQSMKPGIELSEKRRHDYDILPLEIHEEEASSGYATWRPKVKNIDEFRLVYLDTPTGFSLTYKGFPEAVVGVTAHRADQVLISQLQPIFGQRFDEHGLPTSRIKPRGLMPLDWQKVMITLTAELAIAAGMSSVAIKTGSRIPSASAKLSAESAKKAYDDQAERLGFTRINSLFWEKSATGLLTD